jgi:antirestriction protein ArdC
MLAIDGRFAMNNDVATKVTEKILAQLKKGTVPWVKPWDADGEGFNFLNLPYNAVTGRYYNGINIFALILEAEERGYNDPRWLTFNQAKGAGGSVRKGEKGTQVVLVKRIKVEDKENPGKEKQIGILRVFTVFNVVQCDGLPAKYTASLAPKVAEVVKNPVEEPKDGFYACVAKTLADIRHGGSRAFYSPTLDYIQLPEISKFKTLADYRETKAHELIHWTGAEKRLNRDKKGSQFGNQIYAAEELVAELGAAIFCARFGIEYHIQNTAAYIGHWIRLLEDHDRAFFTAASQASAAVDFLIGKEEEEELDKAA